MSAPPRPDPAPGRPTGSRIPYVGIIAAVTAGILLGFGFVSWHVLTDAASSAETRGAIVATWNNLAVAAGAFWLGSSAGGKMDRRNGR